MSNLTILNTQIRTLNNLYSLNDLHRVSGGKEKDKPTRFMRLDQTRNLISEITNEYGRPDLVFNTIHGGVNSGTYACQELVIAYAAWISPAFHLKVIRAFMALNNIQSLPSVETIYCYEFTEKQSLHLVSLWFALYDNLALLEKIEAPLHILGSKYAYDISENIKEYKVTLGVMQRILKPMFADMNLTSQENQHDCLALQTLRQYKPTGLARFVTC